uniref:Uncharacterized protein n=1 Tax=Nelumbo nucifera TaxID=4432 RepID=A0A822XHM4_NELNU|nr:TPA_asm: hypothetical protein HUJ06_020012 [Nelumbo nucifera]
MITTPRKAKLHITLIKNLKSLTLAKGVTKREGLKVVCKRLFDSRTRFVVELASGIPNFQQLSSTLLLEVCEEEAIASISHRKSSSKESRRRDSLKSNIVALYIEKELQTRHLEGESSTRQRSCLSKGSSSVAQSALIEMCKW